MVTRSQVETAIGASGVLRLEPCWVPRSFMIPGRRLKLHPDDLYAYGGHRGGINERWFSSTTNADNGPGTPADEGLSYVRLADGQRVLLKAFVEQSGRPAARIRGDVARGRLEPALQVLRQHGADSPSHASERRTGGAARPARQTRGLLLPAPVQRDRQRLPVHVHGPRAGHDQGRRAALSRELEQGRQRHPVPLARVPARTRDGLADQPAHSARAGLARDLRAAGQQRRLLDVPVGSRRPHHAAGAAREGRPRRVPRRSRLSRRAPRLGRERESDVCRRQPRVPDTGQAVRGNRRGRLSRAVGFLRHAVVLREGTDGGAEADRDDHAMPKPTASSSPRATGR